MQALQSALTEAIPDLVPACEGRRLIFQNDPRIGYMCIQVPLQETHAPFSLTSLFDRLSERLTAVEPRFSELWISCSGGDLWISFFTLAPRRPLAKRKRADMSVGANEVRSAKWKTKLGEFFRGLPRAHIDELADKVFPCAWSFLGPADTPRTTRIELRIKASHQLHLQLSQLGEFSVSDVSRFLDHVRTSPCWRTVSDQVVNRTHIVFVFEPVFTL